MEEEIHVLGTTFMIAFQHILHEEIIVASDALAHRLVEDRGHS